MTVLILHGIGGHAGIHWQQWLHDELASKSYQVIMPELPQPGHPDRGEWLEVASKSVAEVKPEELIVVGHSLGVTTALDLIQQSAAPLAGMVSVAGFGIDYGAELNSYFLGERRIDYAEVRANLRGSVVFFGDNDPYVTQEALGNLATELRVRPVVIKGGGHLNSDAGFTTFPEVLEAVEFLRHTSSS